jgi:peptide/nickel transport system ATP-binding protein
MLLCVEGLTVSYATARGRLTALDRVDFSIDLGETLALVGESGSGKSTAALAIMGLLGTEATLSGRVKFAGRDLATLTADERRGLMGRAISIVFQDPFTSLNPALPVGFQVAEPLLHHRAVRKRDALARAIDVLSEVGLRNAEVVARSYPHQLSGGMRQRVMIASALINDPQLLILDEPTTALDATVEAQILDLLTEIRRGRSLSVLYITHNLRVVHRIADRACVLYAGRVLELGRKRDVLERPLHPYTKGLLASLPVLSGGRGRTRLAPIAGRFPDLMSPPRGCVFEARCPFAEARCREAQGLSAAGDERSVRCWKSERLAPLPWPRAAERTPSLQRSPSAQAPALLTFDRVSKRFRAGGVLPRVVWRKVFGVVPWPTLLSTIIYAVDGVTETVAPGEVLGLVGESGSGKSTLGRIALRLIEASSGRVVFGGQDLARLGSAELRSFRKQAQIVFQNPDSSLNPRRMVGEALARAVTLFTGIRHPALKARVEELLDMVGLPKHYYDRYPHQLSGGEKQRVGIARALASRPTFIVCDEPVSALDVSVQATILNLLTDLRDELGLSYLFISHDLAVVAHLADRIAVMYAGRLCEVGPTAAVLSPPYHPYTETLLAAIAPLDRGATARAALALSRDLPGESPRVGCPFHPRCPRKLGTVCETVQPPLVAAGPSHSISCHIPLEALRSVSPVLPSARESHT